MLIRNKTVLTIFNYELKRNIDVEFTVPDSLSLLGFDIKLFQLWSNIIKNAIEAMDDKKERGKLKINGKKTKKGWLHPCILFGGRETLGILHRNGHIFKTSHPGEEGHPKN